MRRINRNSSEGKERTSGGKSCTRSLSHYKYEELSTVMQLGRQNDGEDWPHSVGAARARDECSLAYGARYKRRARLEIAGKIG